MNVLLTSVGRRSYIVNYFKEALGDNGHIFATNSLHTYAMTCADSSYISPVIYDEEYMPFILNLCKEEKIDVILSLFDIDLPVLAKNQQALANIGTRYIGPSYEAASIANDKLKTYEFFKSIGVKTPRTYCKCDEVIKLLDSNDLTFPLVIKPRWGMGSISVNIAKNVDELLVFFKKCKDEVESSYLKYKSVSDIENAVLIQEFLQGQEYGLDIYKDLSGTLVSTVAKKKIAMRSGETDIAEIDDNHIFQELAETVSKEMYFTGVLDIDCFVAEDGAVYALEINPRISGSYPFSHIAGVNYPEQLVKWLKGGETDMDLLSAKIGIRGCKELAPTIFPKQETHKE